MRIYPTTEQLNRLEQINKRADNGIAGNAKRNNRQNKTKAHLYYLIVFILSVLVGALGSAVIYKIITALNETGIFNYELFSNPIFG